MHHHITPISVWHSQPFEMPVLAAGMRWALVKYHNPREQPRKFSLLKNVFIVRRGQHFGAVGNEECTSISVWQFRWWVGWPATKRIELAVRKLSERSMPNVTTKTPTPAVHFHVAQELERATLQTLQTTHIALKVQSASKLNIASFNLQLNTPNDEPNLKTFGDTL